MLRQAASRLPHLPLRAGARAFATPSTSHKHLAQFPGAHAEYAEDIYFINGFDPMPIYRVMDEDGNVVNPKDDPKDKELAIKCYKMMIKLNTMDQVLYDVQRQGRISFYMTAFGEYAMHFGSAAALAADDVVFGQYREAGVLMYRGFTLDDFCNQCCSNHLDYGKGRQMPVHYGSRALHFQTISSPLGTQIPQTTGAAYALKREGAGRIAVCYMGDGAASEGDFHPALNFATTLECPALFFVRNNGYAISTPTSEQYRGDGIAGRGPGYGMHTIRVDGNDIWAVYNAVRAARKLITERSVPVLLEAMSYRVSHHSTSDDASRYRTLDELEHWQKQDNPMHRLRNYMINNGWWAEEDDVPVLEDARTDVLAALARAEAEPKPPLTDLFADVYDTLQQNQREQQAAMYAHVAKYDSNPAYPKGVLKDR